MFLEIQDQGEWRVLAEAELLVPGWTATFRIPDWDASQAVNYRVVYGDGSWDGTIQNEPHQSAELVVAGFSGTYQTGETFLESALINRIRQHRPDVLFFSGDQVPGGARVEETLLHLDYLHHWYLWCWAFRDLTRDIPSVILPDERDVYQNHLWGAGGRPIHQETAGGYVQPADFLQMVYRTQTSHLPDPFDAEPEKQGIQVLYTELEYGGVSFAHVEDRKWKSGLANSALPPSGTGRPDHFDNPQVDSRQLDLPGLELLGERQLAFLEAWATDWRRTEVKVALSQSAFADLTTHQGPKLTHVPADLDSNGWPQSGRNRGLSVLRKAFAFHLSGNQALATVAQHGIEKHGDANWSFGLPSLTVVEPRIWNPRREGRNRDPDIPYWQGEHWDGFNNLVSIYAAANPRRESNGDLASLRRQMAGYGILRIDKDQRQLTMECWPRFVDSGVEIMQVDGWPVTIDQQNNYARQPQGYLPPLSVGGLSEPVVEVRHADTKALVYALRIPGTTFTPWVFASGYYDVRIGDPDLGVWTELKGIEATLEPYSEARLIEF